MPKCLDGLEQHARGLDQFLALGRQPEPTLATAAQAVSKARFELGHLLADARLAQPEHALGSTETAALHHDRKQPEQLQVQIMQLSKHQTLLRVNVRIIDLLFH
ncbi:hypothetical protein D3C81_1803350 [compost metagenome]